MTEGAPSLSQERNLALERQEAVALHNVLLEEQGSFSDKDKEWDVQTGSTNNPKYGENSVRLMELKKNVENIDRYRNIATSKEDPGLPQIGDISDFEKLKEEKERVDRESARIAGDIESTRTELNAVRKKLNLPETDDIPSLADKKQKLENLLLLKNELDSQFEFEMKKAEQQQNERKENSNMEQRFLNNSLEELCSGLRRVNSLLGERESQGYQGIFSDIDGLRSIAPSLEDSSDKDGIKAALARLGNLITDFGRPELRDDPESMRNLAYALSGVEASLRELPARIQDEEERKEFGNLAYSVADKVDEAVGYVRSKAGLLEDFRR